jgi:hypothetical protein
MPIRINPKPKGKKEPDFLCNLKDCTSCNEWRKKYNIKNYEKRLTKLV